MYRKIWLQLGPVLAQPEGVCLVYRDHKIDAKWYIKPLLVSQTVS